MTDKEQQLLIQDLCARLPHGVKVCTLGGSCKLLISVDIKHGFVYLDNGDYMAGEYSIDDIKPYLRSMEDMTEEDMEDFARYQFANDDVYEFLYAHKTGKGHINVTCTLRQCTDHRHVLFQVNKRTALRDGWRGFDWLNAHHFDYRGLIPKGLAIKVTPENDPYNTK